LKVLPGIQDMRDQKEYDEKRKKQNSEGRRLKMEQTRKDIGKNYKLLSENTN
jgi:hypothetical protein